MNLNSFIPNLSRGIFVVAAATLAFLAFLFAESHRSLSDELMLLSVIPGVLCALVAIAASYKKNEEGTWLLLAALSFLLSFASILEVARYIESKHVFDQVLALGGIFFSVVAWVYTIANFKRAPQPNLQEIGA